MTAFTDTISIQLKTKGYIFDELRSIPRPMPEQYVYVETVVTTKVFITKVDIIDAFRLVKIHSRYYKLN